MLPYSTATINGGLKPPYNIEQLGSLEEDGKDSYRITLAVAGFSEADLAITVEQQQLIVKGRQPGDERSREFLHRGIAARPFQRSFVLAEGVEVAGAELENGLLHIDLIRRAPEVTVQEIRIGSGSNGSGK